MATHPDRPWPSAVTAKGAARVTTVPLAVRCCRDVVRQTPGARHWASGVAEALQEGGNAADGILEVLDAGERDETEMVWIRPVEARSLGDQDLLGPQQVDDELLVVFDWVDIRIQPREAVEGTLRLYAADPRDGVQQFVCRVALLTQAAAGKDQIVDRLVTAQRALDRILRRHVRTHSHVRQQGQPLEEVLCAIARATDHHPATAEAGDAVGLGQPTEG